MNKRFCKLGGNAAKAFFLLAFCGATYSCSDDYHWDDGRPSWLGSSIYEYLDKDGNYKNFVKLIDDLDYKEVLAKTGSKTLFVADDQAFDEFFKTNEWGVRDYASLTLAQKKLLLNSAMINNAYLLEMMSSTPAGGGANDLPVKGECMRRETSADITDSIPFFTADELPYSYNPDDKDYWARFRNPERKGIYLALDATSPMMAHFLPAHMQNNHITNEDFKIITGQERSENDAHIFNAKVIEQDITCQNGYINKLDKVLVMPQNMAEVLRTNGKTKIFSHMLDRFSAPFYNENLTKQYNLIYSENQADSVFQKRYFAKRSQNNNALNTDAGTDPIGNPTGNKVDYQLNFDPGWNTYMASDRTAKELDMGTIFAPVDEKFMDYFFSATGGGRFLIEAYAPEYQAQITEQTTDLDLVFKAIDQIPISVIDALVNNLIKDSFIGSVPSKFETVKNDAQDPMFDETHIQYIKDVKIANNGAIYLMDEVITPAQYASVSAPAYVATDMKIFNWAINQGKKSTSETLGGQPVNYYAYLLAMSSRFSFFVPQDNNFWYIDPLSFNGEEGRSISGTTVEGRAFRFEWDEKKSAPTAASYKCYYDFATQEINIVKDASGLVTSEAPNATVYGNRLKDLLETHTIIHEDFRGTTGVDETETGVECPRTIYMAKNGSVLKVNKATDRAQGMTVMGGMQINTNENIKVIRFDDKSKQSNGNGNGFAYEIESPLQPTLESAYSAMYKNPNFSKFFELCQTDNEVLKELGFKSEAEQNRYTIFNTKNNGLPCFWYQKDENGNFTETFANISKATSVRFFNNYNYTIYVPTNEAMAKAEALGLPTWQDVRDLLQMDVEEKEDLSQAEDEARHQQALKMVEVIVNFVKYHFQDTSIFIDKLPYNNAEGYETATIDSESGIYCKLFPNRSENGVLTVTDAVGKTSNVTADNNIFIRDYVTKGDAHSYSNTIISSSSAVVHGIDNVLDFTTYPGGRYDNIWKQNGARSRTYIKKYKIRK